MGESREPGEKEVRSLQQDDDESADLEAGRAGSRKKKDKVQKDLDEALAASFPASDPVSITTSQSEEDWGLEDRCTGPEGQRDTDEGRPPPSR